MLRSTFEAGPTIMIFNRLVEMLEKHPAAKADCSEERKQNAVVKTKYDEKVPTCLRLIS